MRIGTLTLALLLSMTSLSARAEETYAIQSIDAADLKPVAAEVDSAHRAVARARVGGTITALKVTEGAMVKQGELLAIISDPKQPFAVDAVSARLKSLEQERAQAASDVKRFAPLVKVGAISQMKMDEMNTRLASLNANVNALRAERDSASVHEGEGRVLAPMTGRVLRLPVPAGNVVMPGETLAELTAGELVLKIRVPERHAKYLVRGASVRVISSNTSGEDVSGSGTIRKIYPEVENGNVTADVAVSDLSHLFIGERMTAYVPTAHRKAIYVPPEFITRRYGLHYVTLKTGGEVVVEPGLEDDHGVEILSGLHDGDVLVRP